MPKSVSFSLFSVALLPYSGLGRLIVDIPRSHTSTYIQGVSGKIANILGDGSMDCFE
jgi:hypothetical protein